VTHFGLTWWLLDLWEFGHNTERALAILKEDSGRRVLGIPSILG
jgi:hypothetical protein